MCDEEVGAACQQCWVRLLIQVLSNQLKCRELLGGKGHLQSFGDVASLQRSKQQNNQCTAVTTKDPFFLRFTYSTLLPSCGGV